MKAKSFFSLIFCLLLVSCNNNEILENELDTLSYLKGVWELDKAYFAAINHRTGKVIEIHETVYGDVPHYFVFDNGVHNRYIYPQSALGPDAKYLYTSYSYQYFYETHEFLCRENVEDIYPAITYKVIKATKKYMVLDQNPYDKCEWLRYRLKKITWEEFEQTEYYKKAHAED